MMRRRMEKFVATAALVAVAWSALGAESALQGEEDGSVHLSTVSAGNRVHTKIPSVQTVHAFYYVWYGNPETDGEYKHWNHEILPHWDKTLRDRFNHSERFSPPRDIHAPNYPSRGCYSSRDPKVLRQHMAEMREAGIGVAVVSWWGPEWRNGTTDQQGISTDAVLPLVLDAAGAEGVKVALHLEPYPGRTAETVKEDLMYVIKKHGDHPAFFRVGGLPLYYVYDSYHIAANKWARILQPNGDLSLRGGPADGLFIALWLDRDDHVHSIAPGGFDGFYTYFASEAVSYGANDANWMRMSQWATENGKLFIPSVGPGYDDSKIRPWNAGARRYRDGGRRYRKWWKHAIDCGASMVSITSYNEWGEGTQIEAARDYGSHAGANMTYLELTKEWSLRFRTDDRMSPQIHSNEL